MTTFELPGIVVLHDHRHDIEHLGVLPLGRPVGDAEHRNADRLATNFWNPDI
jgi:hypothetical protein